MSHPSNNSPADARPATDAHRAELAEAFGTDPDPLAAHAPTFEATEADPFAMFEADVLAARDLVDETREHYRRVFRDWSTHMAREGRHPACPSEDHVRRFIRHELDEVGNAPRTVRKKLERLQGVFEWWQADAAFPHSRDFDPFTTAIEKERFDGPPRKEFPRIGLDDLREIVGDIAHIRDRAMVTLQFKLGLRVSELCNIQLADIDLGVTELERHYPSIGTNIVLAGRENAVYIPHDRPGNKSERPRVLPLDGESRRVLLRYLLIRPTIDDPWVFVSHSSHRRLKRHAVQIAWQDAFHPKYAETERHRAVSSHYGRHWFTTYWRVDQDLNRELIKYMRGDKPGGGRSIAGRDAIDGYIHTYYEDIEPVYRERIFTLGV